MTALVQALLELERARSLSAVGAVLRSIAAPLGYDRVLVFATGTGLEGAVSFAGRSIDASASARLLLDAAATAAFRAARHLAEAPAELSVGALSTREREVLRWVAAGRRQAEIAATLGLSARTVENHLRRARQRLGVATTAQAIRAASRRGEIED
ncbi:response regulator transcription factor [Stenotrophomonas maltophilia]|uniref:helix-turn-helix transcriptional regulator n=1 Tax=Stenotrophomonas maltophilia TaxID=40324 RepID=UPI0039C12A01